MQKIITRDDLFRTCKSLSKDFEIIGPRDLANKGIFYQTVGDAEDLYLGDRFATEPIKRFFLEPSSWVFKCAYEEGRNAPKDASLPERRRIVIGLRPCEARGLELLDKVFDPSAGSGSTLSGAERVDAEYKDRGYVNNRARSVIIGLACSKPDRSCFCTSLGGSPVEGRGMDALLFDSNGGFVVDVITDKGKSIFGGAGKDLSEDQKRSFESDKAERTRAVTLKGKIPETLDGTFGSAYWAAASSACLSCGVCTYLCPTCHCFDLVDEERRKLQCYDGCAFPHFTGEASGENPRPTKKERYRQRVFHKFDYFKKSFGENLCVGCGRCIRYCPVKIDIREVVSKIPVTGNQ